MFMNLEPHDHRQNSNTFEITHTELRIPHKSIRWMRWQDRSHFKYVKNVQHQNIVVWVDRRSGR